MANLVLHSLSPAAQHALEDALARQREAELARDSEAAAHAAAATEQRLALDAARRAEAGLRERLGMAERQLTHQSGEVRALREANEKLDLTLAALRVSTAACSWSGACRRARQPCLFVFVQGGCLHLILTTVLKLLPAVLSSKHATCHAQPRNCEPCLQEELEAARQVPHAQLGQVQMELQRAAAHTDALEAQVQQLKQQAAAAVEEHEAAVRQQAQEGVLDAAEQVAAAMQAAAERHSQEMQELETRLADVQQQLEAAQAELALLRQAQAAQQAQMVEAAVQADSPCPSSRHAGTQTPATAGGHAALQMPPAPAPRMPLQHMQPSRGGSACDSPALHGCERPVASVAETAAQLQLELARVKLTPLKPLVGSNAAASGASAKHGTPPSRLGSAFAELGSTVVDAAAHPPLPGRDSFSGLAGRRHANPLARSNSSSLNRLTADDEDGCFATPLAHTPASLSPELSPYGSMLPPAGAGQGCMPRAKLQQEGWPMQGVQQQGQSLGQSEWEQQQQQQPPQQLAQVRSRGPPVPPLDLQLVRPYTSLSCDSSGREERPFRCSSAGGGSGGSGSWGGPSAEASVPSAGSLSSLGPSASQLGGGWTPAASGVGGGSGSLLQLSRDRSEANRSPAAGSGLGSSWQSAALDASLARLAVLTAGLTASSSRRRG